MEWLSGVLDGIVWQYEWIAWLGLGLGLCVSLIMQWFIVRYQQFFIPSLLSRSSTVSRITRWCVVLLGGFIVMHGMFAAAGPSQRSLIPQIEYTGACIAISVDASYSMLAMEYPKAKQTRLQRALAEIESLVTSFPLGDRLGLMAFSDAPRIFSPLWTTDRNHIFFIQLHSINESYVALNGRSGSNIPAAIGKWLGLFPEADSCQRFVIVFTDGEPEGDAIKLEQHFISSLDVFSTLNRAVHIFLVVVGDSKQEMRIPEHDNTGRFIGFAAKDDGSYIFSRPHLAYLDDIVTRFRGKLIFMDKHSEDLQQKIAAAVGEAREIAAIRSKVLYQPIGSWFTGYFLGGIMLFLSALTMILRNKES